MALQISNRNLIKRIERLAWAERRLPEEILASALDAYTAQPHKKSEGDFLLSIAGQGHSGQTDVAAHDEEILTREIDPVTGWRPEADDKNPA